jgi:nitrite reductase (NADH) small subunit
MSEWKKICGLEEIPSLGARVVKTTQGDIAIFRTSSDEVFALHDQCPHKGGPLSQGIVAGKTVTCPLHGWKIGLDSGTAEAPDEGHTPCLTVKVDEAGEIWLDMQTQSAPCAA